MPKDATVKIVAPDIADLQGPRSRVSGMQAKLHHRAAADPGRRFDDLFNFTTGDAARGVRAGCGQCWCEDSWCRPSDHHRSGGEHPGDRVSG